MFAMLSKPCFDVINGGTVVFLAQMLIASRDIPRRAHRSC